MNIENPIIIRCIFNNGGVLSCSSASRADVSVTDDMIRDYVLLRLKGTGKKPKVPMAQGLAKIERTRPVSNATANRELQYLAQAYNLKVKEIGPEPAAPAARSVFEERRASHRPIDGRAVGNHSAPVESPPV